MTYYIYISFYPVQRHTLAISQFGHAAFYAKLKFPCFTMGLASQVLNVIVGRSAIISVRNEVIELSSRYLLFYV